MPGYRFVHPVRGANSLAFSVSAPRKQSGYTLMEIIVVILVVSAVSSIALPSMSNFYTGQTLAAQASILTADLRLARSWAISEQVFTRIVFNSDLTAWVVEQHVDGSGPVLGDPTSALTASQATDYTDTADMWESIIEENEREVEQGINVTITPGGTSAIFFRYDGMVTVSPSATSAPIGVMTAQFSTGDYGMAVDITPNGGIESREFYSETY